MLTLLFLDMSILDCFLLPFGGRIVVEGLLLVVVTPPPLSCFNFPSALSVSSFGLCLSYWWLWVPVLSIQV